jgi:hypothetical protein
LVLGLELALSAASGLGLVGVAPVLRKLFKKTTIEDITPEWIESFSVERYRPMMGLLSEEDFDFLARQPGFDAGLYKKLRRERLDIFHQYFSRLILDYKKLHTTARYFIAQCEDDQSELAQKLIRMRFAFALSALRVQYQFVLCQAGIGTVEARLLVTKLQQMSDQLGSLAVPQAA